MRAVKLACAISVSNWACWLEPSDYPYMVARLSFTLLTQIGFGNVVDDIFSIPSFCFRDFQRFRYHLGLSHFGFSAKYHYYCQVHCFIGMDSSAPRTSPCFSIASMLDMKSKKCARI